MKQSSAAFILFCLDKSCVVLSGLSGISYYSIAVHTKCDRKARLQALFEQLHYTSISTTSVASFHFKMKVKVAIFTFLTYHASCQNFKIGFSSTEQNKVYANVLRTTLFWHQ
jgi:hypothetical protein